jgi:hypothetical protein
VLRIIPNLGYIRVTNTQQALALSKIKDGLAGDEVIIPHDSMTRLKPGDRIDVRIKSATIVAPYSNYDEIKTFEIVSTDEYGYFLYIPHYFYLKETVIAHKSRCQKFGIDKKFIDENIVYIMENMICHVHEHLDGMKCCKCNEFYHYASPNQENETLICWNCRQYPSYR